MVDEDLPTVIALQAGDAAALDVLMARYKVAIFSFICRYVRNETDAEELTQETFVRAYFRIQSFTPRAKFVTWLFTIAINLCRDHVRSRHYREAGRTVSLVQDVGKPVDLPSGAAAPDEAAGNQERLRAVDAAIDVLPHNLKIALLLTAIEGLSHLEAAGRLGVTVKTVETRVYRARKRLEQCLANS